jgi:hypothetical protein
MHTIEIVEKLAPNLKYITFNKDAAKNFAKNIDKKDLENGKISFVTHDWDLENKIFILFYLNSMNYCFWGGKNKKKWTVQINGEEFDGFFALYKILEENAKKNKNFLTPSYIASFSFEDVKNLLDGDPEIPLLESRYKNLTITGKVIQEKYNGDIMSIIEDNDYDTKKILNEIEMNFPSYQDTQEYKGYKIHFLKRGQLLVKMINDELEKYDKYLKNPKYLTAIADYKVPQLVRYYGISEYSEELADLVDNYIVLEKDSDYEIEIRIATLWGIELIRRELENKFPQITNADIDNILWVSSQKIRNNIKPYHRTFTTAY